MDIVCADYGYRSEADFDAGLVRRWHPVYPAALGCVVNNASRPGAGPDCFAAGADGCVGEFVVAPPDRGHGDAVHGRPFLILMATGVFDDPDADGEFRKVFGIGLSG